MLPVSAVVFGVVSGETHATAVVPIAELTATSTPNPMATLSMVVRLLHKIRRVSHLDDSHEVPIVTVLDGSVTVTTTAKKTPL